MERLEMEVPEATETDEVEVGEETETTRTMADALGEFDEEHGEDEGGDEGEAEVTKEEVVEPSKLNYEVVPPEGSAEAAVAWPEGARVKFKADRREVEVDNLTELVTLAQKGVYMERRTQEFSTTRDELQGRLSAAQEAITDKNARLDRAEEILLKVLWDDEALEKAREATQDMKDPAALQAKRAERKLAERDEQDTAARQQQETEANKVYWQDVEDRYGATLELDEAKDEFPHLRPEDAPLIQQGVYQAYEGFVEARTKMHVGAGLSKEEASSRATREGVEWLAQEDAETILSVMQSLNEVFSERLGDAKETRKGGHREPDPKADPMKHNRRTDKKLDERRRQSVRGAGAGPPAGKPLGKPKGSGQPTHTDRWNEIEAIFDEALGE